MIPADLAEFRALMRIALAHLDHNVFVTDSHVDNVAAALDALATATPAQLCGIVGTVQVLDSVPHGVNFTVTDGDLIVTPREGEG